MGEHIHYIVSRSRFGWSVSVEADRLSDHRDAKSALAEADSLTGEARAEGCEASLVDLSDHASDADET